MGLDEATWYSPGYDQMNAVIQQQHKDKPLDEVLKIFQSVHEKLVAKIRLMSDEDLQRLYKPHPKMTGEGHPIIAKVMSNTYEHYAEHRPWIAAIVKDEK